MAAGPAGEQNLQVLAHSQSMSYETQTKIIEEFEQHLSLASTQGQEAPLNAYDPGFIYERMDRMDLAATETHERFDAIVATETWDVPTFLTSNQNQLQWVLIKTSVNEENVRLNQYDFQQRVTHFQRLGTARIKVLKVYIAEHHQLQQILMNNVLLLNDLIDLWED